MADSEIIRILEEQEQLAIARAANDVEAERAAAKRQINNRPADDGAERESRARPVNGHSRNRLATAGPLNRYSSEREENDQRRARRSRDGDLRAGSPAESANGSVRSRARSRSPARGRQPKVDSYRPGGRSENWVRPQYRDRSPGRLERPAHDEYRGAPRGRGGRRPSPRPRSTERVRDRRGEQDLRGGRRSSPGSRSSDRSRDLGGDRHGQRGDRRDREPHRNSSPNRRGGRARTPEPSSDERDRRTVFVQQLANRLRSSQLKDFFMQAGEVVEAQIVKDRVSQRSKGVGYVEFKDEESVQKAIALTGQKLAGIPIIAQHTEAEKNRQIRTTENNSSQPNGALFHRLYVGNIHFSLSEDDLRGLFEAFGELEYVQLQKEESGRSKGFGFVQFAESACAQKALEAMNGYEIAGRPIRVGLGNDRFTAESTKALLAQMNSQAGQQQGSAFSGMGGRGTHAGGNANFDRAGGRNADRSTGASALDDADVNGVQFSNVDRFALMKKLARTDEVDPSPAAYTAVRQSKVDTPKPTRCVVLKNCYDQANETGDTWQEEIKTDVKDECEKQFGKVKHIALALDNDEGEIYIKFDTVAAGESAIRGLQGRWFGKQRISADYIIDAIYNLKYPKAKVL